MALKISEMTAAGALSGSEMVEIVQAGVSKRTSVGAIAALGPGGGNGVNALTIASPSGVVNIDLSLGTLFTLALTANVTDITFSGLPGAGNGKTIAIRMRQDATGGRTVALPTSFKAISGSDGAVQPAANAYTMMTLTTFDNGTRWEYSMKGCAA